MAKVTSKLQLTIPKAMATRQGIRPGDNVIFESAGDIIRLIPAQRETRADGGQARTVRLRLFDQATKRQQRRNAELRRKSGAKREPASRGWKREELHTRGRAR